MNLKNRKILHFKSLIKREHHSIRLQSAFNKYNERNFVFEIIENISQLLGESKLDFKKRLVCEKEQFYLDTLLFAQEFIITKGKDKRFYKLGYNVHPTAHSSLGVQRGIEWRLKSSKARKGKPNPTKGIKRAKQSEELIKRRFKSREGYKHSKTTRENISQGHLKSEKSPRKKVYQFNLKNELIRTYRSTQECMRLTKFFNISYHCREEKLAYSFYWSYNENFLIREKETKPHPLKGRKKPEFVIDKFKETMRKKKLNSE